MKAALLAAGFGAVEEERGVIYARLPISGAEFHAVAMADEWLLSLTRPLRATAAQLANWRATHPETGLDIWQGETRLTLLARANATAVQHWAAVAEDLVAETLRWRRSQRAGGEGF